MSEFQQIRQQFEPAARKCFEKSDHVVINVEQNTNNESSRDQRRISLKTLEWLSGKVETLRRKFSATSIEYKAETRTPKSNKKETRKGSESDGDLIEISRKYKMCGTSKYTWIAEEFETIVVEYGRLMQENQIKIHREGLDVDSEPPRGILLMPMSSATGKALLDFSEMGGYSLGRGSRVAKMATRALSRTHCMIYLEDNKVFIKDCDSKTGTFVNGKLLGSSVASALDNFDIIQMGYGTNHEDFIQSMVIFLDSWNSKEFASCIQMMDSLSFQSRTFSSDLMSMREPEEKLEKKKEISMVSPLVSSPKMTQIAGKTFKSGAKEEVITFERPRLIEKHQEYDHNKYYENNYVPSPKPLVERYERADERIHNHEPAVQQHEVYNPKKAVEEVHHRKQAVGKAYNHVPTLEKIHFESPKTDIKYSRPGYNLSEAEPHHNFSLSEVDSPKQRISLTKVETPQKHFTLKSAPPKQGPSLFEAESSKKRLTLSEVDSPKQRITLSNNEPQKQRMTLSDAEPQKQRMAHSEVESPKQCMTISEVDSPKKRMTLSLKPPAGRSPRDEEYAEAPQIQPNIERIRVDHEIEHHYNQLRDSESEKDNNSPRQFTATSKIEADLIQPLDLLSPYPRPPVPKPRRTKKNLSKSAECLVENEVEEIIGEVERRIASSIISSPTESYKVPMETGPISSSKGTEKRIEKMPIVTALSARRTESKSQILNVEVPEFLKSENMKIPPFSKSQELLTSAETIKDCNKKVNRKLNLPVNKKRAERLEKLKEEAQFVTIVQGANTKRFENFVDFGTATSDISDGVFESTLSKKQAAMRAVFNNFRVTWILEALNTNSGTKLLIKAHSKNKYELIVEGKTEDSLLKIGTIEMNLKDKLMMKVSFKIDDLILKEFTGKDVESKESLPLKALDQLTYFYPHLEIPSIIVQGPVSGPTDKATISLSKDKSTSCQQVGKIVFEGQKISWSKRQMHFALDLDTSSVELDSLLCDTIQSVALLYCLRYHID